MEEKIKIIYGIMNEQIVYLESLLQEGTHTMELYDEYQVKLKELKKIKKQIKKLYQL